MRIIDHISEDTILTGVNHFVSKDKIIQSLVKKICQVNNLPGVENIYNAVIEQEKKMSTGIGCGLAVPHAKVEAVDKMYIAGMNLKRGVDFSSIDKEPVYLLFLLISPKDTVGPHIRALSSICRLASDADLRRKLIDAKTPSEFYYQLKLAEEKYS